MRKLNRKYPKGGACLIATAACGTPQAEAVILLSQFRDEILAKNAAGQSFISFYYRVSPPIATFISRFNLARTVVRKLFVIPLSKVVRLIMGENHVIGSQGKDK